MRAPLLLVGLLVASVAPLPATRAGCCTGDPSALDVDPTVEPLRVALEGSNDELVLTWESKGSGYRVWQGELDGLFAMGTLNDQVVAHVAVASVRLPSYGGDAYFLVTADCFGLHCTRGRDSNGAERGTPGCEVLERGELYPDSAICLGSGNGIVRTDAEYDAFAGCFFPGTAPSAPVPGQALVWATDYSNAACGTCLEFPCARRYGEQLIVETAGTPWGDCDAVHHGGAWARVWDAAVISILEEMPPVADYEPCP